MMSHNNRLRNPVNVSFPEGLAIFDSLNKCLRSLGDSGFIEKVMQEGPRSKTFVVITDKWRRAAQKVREYYAYMQ
jgi:hypothetical protein